MTIEISAALKAHLGLDTQTRTMLWKVTLTNGTVLGFSNHDIEIVYSGLAYSGSVGYSRSDIQTAAALEVDAMEVTGFLQAPAMTEADLAAGIWDFASFEIFIVNYKDLTQGRLIYKVGTIGEVTIARGRFKAELRGKTQAYTRIIGRLTQPGCDAVLGDARCMVDLVGGSPSLTVTGALTGVGADNRTLFDTSRTEAGPSAGIAITGITQANPGVVTLAAPLGLPNNSPVTISGVVGMTQVNSQTVAVTVDDTTNTFTLSVDTSAFGAYVSGGTVIEMGTDSGFFDNGVITFTSGLNNGHRREVQSYVPGQIILELPMYYALAIGDTYSMHAGCNYAFATCRDRFNNAVNFRGFKDLAGMDKLMQVGRVQ